MIPVYAIYPSLSAQTLLGNVKKYPPLALGAVIGYAKTYEDGALTKKFRFLKNYFLFIHQLELAYKENGPGIFIFSNYFWSLTNNLTIAQAIKRWATENITIFGGPSIPLKRKDVLRFMKSCPQVDICVLGEGENTFAELLDKLGSMILPAKKRSQRLSALSEVQGIVCRCSQ